MVMQTANTPTNQSNAINFALSSSAAARVSRLLSDEPEGSYLRISVEGGGCSGFQYHFDFDTTALAEDDHRICMDGAIAVIDDTSLGFLTGSVLDYVETLGAAAFEIKNPNASSSCGCGNSFSV